MSETCKAWQFTPLGVLATECYTTEPRALASVDEVTNAPSRLGSVGIALAPE